jgi:hypothetical protein
MPVKTHKTAKKHPHHYAKVYWPYIPLVLFVIVGLWVGKPFVERSQRGVLAYTTDVTSADLLVDTNQARQDQGSQAVTINPQLSQAAQAKANDMVARNYWSHITPDGKTPWVFIDETGYQYKKAGENLAFGFVDTNDIITGWLNSPAHKQNLLDSAYSQVGFGVANSQNYQGNGPETVVVAFYGEPGEKAIFGNTTDSSRKAVAAFNTDNALANEANATISKAQTITKGQAPWITFALGVIGGAALVYIIVKNSVVLHRKLKKGEKFVLKHPLLDITVVVFVVMCGLLVQSVGSIR